MSEQTLHDVITDLAKVIELEQKAHMKAVEMIEQAVIAERESCAKMIESFVEDYDREYRELGFELAERIRLRSEKRSIGERTRL